MFHRDIPVLKSLPMDNDRWAYAILRTCIAQGVQHVLLCPGARSTPLAIALYILEQEGLVSVVTHYDERGAGFYALGMAKATARPVAIVTTSGTAVANLLPALVEAQKSQTPMVVITADRPPELTFSGANQTINQGPLLVGVVAYSQSLPVPTSEISVETVAYTVAHAVSKAVSERQPVALNCPFREPLSSFPTQGFPCVVPQIQQTSSWLVLPETVLVQIATAMSGVIVVGAGADTSAVLALAAAYQWPIIPDVCHPLRYFSDPLIITYADLLAETAQLGPTDLVLHVGDPMTGKSISEWLKKERDVYIRIHHRDDFGDPLFRAHYIGVGAIPFAQLMSVSVHPSAFEIPLHKAALLAPLLNQKPSEYTLFHDWDAWLPIGWALFLGNSQPIRQISQIARASSRAFLKVGTNRGASGIDGLIATAGGFMAGHQTPGVLILGDLSFLHDVSSLPLVAQQPLLIVVIQNHGGEIFSRFAVKDHPSFGPFFHLTHGYSCSAAASWALGYSRCVAIHDARHAIDAAIAWIQVSGKAAFLEIVVGG